MTLLKVSAPPGSRTATRGYPAGILLHTQLVPSFGLCPLFRIEIPDSDGVPGGEETQVVKGGPSQQGQVLSARGGNAVGGITRKRGTPHMPCD